MARVWETGLVIAFAAAYGCGGPGEAGRDTLSFATDGVVSTASASRTTSDSSDSGPNTGDAGFTSGDGANCCDPHVSTGCNEPAVQECVCEIDSACCTREWGANCVGLARVDCAATCMPTATSGDDTTGGATATDTGADTGPSDSSGSGGGPIEVIDGGPCCFGSTTPGCLVGELEACVCAFDPFCCTDAWDAQCILESVNECHAGCGSCCTAHNFPACGEADIANCVCDIDVFCCTNFWDQNCIDQAEACGAVC